MINHETSGVLVPLVLACNDLDHLVRVRSPLRTTLRAARDKDVVSDTHYAGLLPTTEAIVSADPRDQKGSGEALVARFLSAEDERPDLFQDLAPEQIERLLARSYVLCCDKGDALIRTGHTSRTLYVVLEGALEVRRGNSFATEDGVRVLALSEANLSKLISSEAELAAKLLLNLSRALCYKLVTSVAEDD